MSALHLRVSSLPSVIYCITQLSILLSSYANATEKQPCLFELSTYSDIDVFGTGFLNTIVRDNCQTAQLFCDTTTQVCERLRLVGQKCQYHRDCQSVPFCVFYCQSLKVDVDVQYNCLQNVCASPPEEPFEVALWQYAVTTLAVVLGNFFHFALSRCLLSIHGETPQRWQLFASCW